MLSPSELLLDAVDKKLLGEVFHRILHRDRLTPAVFLLCTHEWGNIGDLAINYNEIALLERLFPKRQIFPVSRSTLAANWQRLRETVTPDDLIAVHGGGNMGDIWPHEEEARLAVIDTFSQNCIISMPQSIHFGDPEQLRRSMHAYRRHPRLLLSVRDDTSMQIALEHLDEHMVVRTEDVVTQQEYPFSLQPHEDRVLFVQRDDREKRPGSGIDSLRAAVAAAGHRFDVTDTTLPRLPFSNVELAAKLVYQKIDELHASNVVVTDRLHGALFALIAGRPLIVFENSYGKIGGALKNLLPALGSRILFADGIDDLTADMVGEMAALPAISLRPHTVLGDAHRAFDAQILRHFDQ